MWQQFSISLLMKNSQTDLSKLTCDDISLFCDVTHKRERKKSKRVSNYQQEVDTNNTKILQLVVSKKD